MSNPNPKSPGKNIGQGMLILCFALGLLTLTAFFDDWLGNQSNPNQRPDFYEDALGNREVVLERNRQGHYVSGGSINGVAVNFLLDTGATDVAIPQEIAHAVNLKPGRSNQANTANGIITVYATEIDILKIGNISLHGIQASITPSMFGDTILLGMSALKEVEFTQRGSTLTLRQVPES
jgi:aspartyl protease family protein